MASPNSTEQTNDFMNMQKQYWNAFLEAQRSFANPMPQNPFGMMGMGAQQNPWGDFFKEWQRIVSTGGEMPNASNASAFSEQFAQSGKVMMEMMQKVYNASTEAKPIDQVATDWMTNMRDLLSDIIDGKKQDPLSASDPMGFFASMPTIGYYREQQEQYNELYKKWQNYVQKSSLYDKEMAKVGMEALQVFQEYMANPPEGEEPLETLRDVYNKWVDICEDVYAKYAMSKEYTELYGEVVNSLMSVKQKVNEITDNLFDQMGLPTRKEMDSVHKRLHDLRRDNLDLKRELAEMKSATGIKNSPAKTTAKAAPAAAKVAKPAPVKKPAPTATTAAKKSAKKGKK